MLKYKTLVFQNNLCCFICFGILISPDLDFGTELAEERIESLSL